MQQGVQTSRDPSPAQLVLVDALLMMLSRRMRGALDLGLTLLLEPPRTRYESFVGEHVAAPMRAAALVLRLSVAEFTPQPATTVFEAMSADTEGFVATLAALGRFDAMPDDELVALTLDLEKYFRRLNDSILDVAARLNFHPSAAGHAEQGGDAVHEAFVERLYADLVATREGRRSPPL